MDERREEKDFWQEFKDLFLTYKIESFIVAIFVIFMIRSGVAAVFVFLTMLLVLFCVSKPFSAKVRELWKEFRKKD